MAVEKDHFAIEHRPRTLHRNADGLKANAQLQKTLTTIGTFARSCREMELSISRKDDKLPLVPWFDVQGRVITNRPELPEHLRNSRGKHSQATLKIARIRHLSLVSRENAFRTPLPLPTNRLHYLLIDETIPTEVILNTQRIGLN